MDYRQLVILIGVSFLMVSHILFVQAFYTAYSNPDKKVVIAINDYGEAKVEAFLILPLTSIIGTFSLISLLWRKNA